MKNIPLASAVAARPDGDFESLERFAENIAVDARRVQRKAENLGYRLIGIATPGEGNEKSQDPPQAFSERVRLCLIAAQNAIERTEAAMDMLGNAAGLDHANAACLGATASEAARSR